MKKELQSKDLRIGNYVKLAGYEYEYHIVLGCDIAELDDPAIDLKALPIKLTEEWLLKFGWKKDSIISEDDAYSFKGEIVFIGETGVRYFGLTTILKYVHELQNLYFAITGEELELKNKTP